MLVEGGLKYRVVLRVFAGLYFEFPNGKKRVLLVQQRASGEWCLPGGPIKFW